MFEHIESGKAAVITSSSSKTSCITVCKRLYRKDQVVCGHEGVLGTALPHVGVHVTLVKRLNFLTTYRWHQHKTRLLLQMQKYMARIDSLLLECGKKWRDCAKVIPMKLSLLKNTLKGYEMEYTPCQFFYTVALFGQWHPAAQSSFGSHWNEQGLQRLRSSVSTAAKDIEKRLLMSVIPVLTNFLLSCQELVGIEEAELELVSARSTSPATSHLVEKLTTRKNELQCLINNSQWLMYKVDEALHECKFAGRNLLLFLQFLKENMLLATVDDDAAEEPPPQANHEVHPSEYLPLFDPRIPRAPEGIMGPKAQAECMTGTHLYAYFSEAPLPDDVVEFRKPFNGFYSNISAEKLPGIKHVDTLKEIMAIAEENRDFDPDSFARLSLLSQFKITNSKFQHVLQHGQHLKDMHFRPLKACHDEGQDSTDMDMHVVFHFEDTQCKQVIGNDIVHVHDISILTDDDVGLSTVLRGDDDDGDGMNYSDDVSTDEDDDDDNEDSVVPGKICIENGHLVVFALSMLEYLVVWRCESTDGATQWYARRLMLDLSHAINTTAELTYIKLYSCGAAESRPSRLSLVGCLSNGCETADESTPEHLLFKADLLTTEFEYLNITDVVNNQATSLTNNIISIGQNVLSVLNDVVNVSPKVRKIQFAGTLVEIKTCATRGLLSLMLSDDADHRGVAQQMIILDMEEDEEEEEDDDDDEDEDDDDEDDDDNSAANSDNDMGESD